MPTGGSAQVIATELERVEKNIPVVYDFDDTFYSTIEKRPAEIVSEISMRMPLEIHPNGNSGQFSSDGGDYGTGNMPDYDKAEINTVEMVHRMQWTDRRDFATDNSRKAVVNTFRRDLKNAMREFRRFCDSLCMTAGNGVLATITTVTNTGGLGGVDTYTLTTDGFGARLLRMKQPFNVWDPTLTILRNPGSYTGELTVSYYDGPNKTIQATNSPNNVQAGDLIVASGNWTAPPTSILGVPYHNSTSSVGTWLGFNRATTPEIRANGVAAGGSFSLPMARLALNKIGDRVGIDHLKHKMTVWMHPCQKSVYEELGVTASIINKEPKEQGLDLYFGDNMQIVGAPLKTSFSWDKTRMDFINIECWGRSEFYPPQWKKDKNGNRYFQMRGNSGGIAGSTLAYIIASWNMYLDNPAAASYINTLTVPAGY